MDTLPLPSLQMYTVFSGLGLFYAVAYVLTASDSNFVNALWDDAWCATAVVNFVCCLFFQLMSFLHKSVFGTLRSTEKRHLQDKFWNFVFYKFIFIFGVLNIQEIREMLVWCSWFALIGCFLLTSQLCKDRFLYLSFSPSTPSSSHAKMIMFLSCILVSCAGLFMVCAIIGWQFGFNYFAFVFSEIYVLFTLTLLTLIRQIIHLWDMHHEGLWENRNVYTYYAEFVLEISSLSVQFFHHLHMLLFANMFLSVASLILLMKLRFLYQEIQHKLKRHHNYVMVKHTLERSFNLVGPNELRHIQETCAICWEKMNTARQLPCGHVFHFGCLRSWLEQDPVCPTCRQTLDTSLQRNSREPTTGDQRSGVRTRRRRNWLLYFNGASIASWLPTFSLELHQPPPHHHNTFNADMDREVNHVHTMFPDVPVNAIIVDLANTHSVSQTVDNILSGLVPSRTSNQNTTEDHQDDVTPATSTSDIDEATVRQRDTGGKNEEKEREEENGKGAQSSDFSSTDVPSFQTRKQELINAARKKYLQKHSHLKQC
ncbi:PREDICTED: E3 ubiquitin-protein ligase AMFR-like [Amphimedon queenslandica]|uniref:RING-type domain-containing protein n=1 Tax=Amphimedon queenslandica TaxID=400682 RepID=A0A1X7VCB5_AMPQE|nr:PREDICTED: E3 ubiquitin-protein ligase AMFR-like [Amphimedon queenslandica]|eukprot:XP_019849864.1 PREDICTED: E3 ubiquitin-protein ligase AMFR-like [Amphimedon queenslandica]